MTSVLDPLGNRNLVRNKGNGIRTADPLPRLLHQLLERSGQPADIERAASRPWASALFEGRRHVLRLRLGGTDAPIRSEAFRRDLASVEWTLSGHFVADICVDAHGIDAAGAWMEISALTIADW